MKDGMEWKIGTPVSFGTSRNSGFHGPGPTRPGPTEPLSHAGPRQELHNGTVGRETWFLTVRTENMGYNNINLTPELRRESIKSAKNQEAKIHPFQEKETHQLNFIQGATFAPRSEPARVALKSVPS